jgi:hypothetical protein
MKRIYQTFPILCLMVLALSARAANISVEASLSQPRISFGEIAELQVRVTGADRADVPQRIAADGLQIRLSGQSTQVQMVNFKVSSSVVYSYVILPQRAGTFTVPGITVAAGGQQFRTPDLPLTVTDQVAGPVPLPPTAAVQSQQAPPQSSAPSPYPPRSQPRNPSGKLAFAEISFPKHTLYVGEVAPVEIRFYFDASCQVQVRGKTDFGGEGIVVERFPDPKEGREERNGTIYNVLTFRTLLSAVKPGTVEVPPAKLNTLIEVPGGVPPGFDDPVFRQLMGGRSPFAQQKEMTITSEALRLEILPLPKEGRPASFAGAVGQFDIDALVKNPKPAPGDPATLSVKIGGKGNFKGMGAPVLTETEGWRSYPPSDSFEASDDLSFAGVKSFDYTLIALEAKQSSPGAEFSYFDPASAKYVTLTTKPMPLLASPGTSSPAPSSVQGAASPSATPRISSRQPAEGEPSSSVTLRSWEAPVRRLEFLIATASLLAGAVLLAAFLWYRRVQERGGSARSVRRRRIASLLASLEEGKLDAAATYDAAIEYAELALPASEKRDLLTASLLSRRDLLKYGFGGSRDLPAEEREKILDSLRELTRNP